MDHKSRAGTDESGDLLPRVAAGDTAALVALFRRWHRPVYRFALHMTGSPSTAEDVTQDVFLAAMRDASRYEPGRSTEIAWLCGIARNHVRQRLDRQRRSVPLPEAGSEAEGHAPAAAGDALTDLLRSERIEAVRKAVATLPLRYREVVVLCDLQELSYQDAADALECAVGTVRSRLSRGRSLLASKLGVRVEAEGQGEMGLAPRPKLQAKGVI